MESHIGDTTVFGSFDGVSRCKQGHLRPNGFASRDLYENFCESFEGAVRELRRFLHAQLAERRNLHVHCSGSSTAGLQATGSPRV